MQVRHGVGGPLEPGQPAFQGNPVLFQLLPLAGMEGATTPQWVPLYLTVSCVMSRECNVMSPVHSPAAAEGR
jgi:hypothetical protein